MSKLQVVWSIQAKTQLKAIYQYLKYEKKTPQGAASVRNDILQASREITFEKQYQADEIQPEYRRIIVRHYELLYKEKEGRILILNIFDTRMDPLKQKNDNPL
jgi:plasmid stabilization system protein ParE